MYYVNNLWLYWGLHETRM